MLDPATADAIRARGASLLREIPPERIAREILKIADRGALHTGMRLIADFGLLDVTFPDLAHLPGLPQNPRDHHLDAWQHALAVLEAAEKAGAPRTVVLVALYHDAANGLPGIRTWRRDQPSDIGHARAGAPIAYRAVVRLGGGRALARDVAILVEHQMIRPALTPKSAVRALRPLARAAGTPERFRRLTDELLTLLRADAAGFTPGFARE